VSKVLKVDPNFLAKGWPVPERGKHCVKATTHAPRLTNQVVGLVVAAVAIIGAFAIVVAVYVGTPSSVLPPPAVKAPVAKDFMATPQGRAYLAEIYREGVDSDVLDANGAVVLAGGLCAQHARGVTLATLAQNVRGMFPKLTKMQAAAVPDMAIKYYCPGS
jgi:hypothetical protein